MKRAREAAHVKARAESENMARQLVATRIRMKAQAGEGAVSSGPITTTDIAEAIEAQTGLQIDRRRHHARGTIRSPTGLHEVLMRPPYRSMPCRSHNDKGPVVACAPHHPTRSVTKPISRETWTLTRNSNPVMPVANQHLVKARSNGSVPRA